MSTKLGLKFRRSRREAMIGESVINDLKQKGYTDEAIGKMLFDLVMKKDSQIHDSTWFIMIATWTPEGGLAGPDLGTWLAIILKTEEMTEETDHVNLSRKQAEVIWSRMKSPEFKMRGQVPTAYAGFVEDFKKLFGFHYESEANDEEPTEE